MVILLCTKTAWCTSPLVGKGAANIAGICVFILHGRGEHADGHVHKSAIVGANQSGTQHIFFICMHRKNEPIWMKRTQSQFCIWGVNDKWVCTVSAHLNPDYLLPPLHKTQIVPYAGCWERWQACTQQRPDLLPLKSMKAGTSPEGLLHITDLNYYWLDQWDLTIVSTNVAH